jgi:tetratricopeptide (TPR) repeat protein
VYRVVFSADGTALLSSGYDQTVRLWNVTNGKLLHTIRGTDTGPGRSVAFSPDGRVILSTSLQGGARLLLLDRSQNRILQDLTSAIRREPDNADALVARGTLHSELKRNGQAEQDAEAALKIDRKHAGAYFLRALCRLERNDAQRALQDLSAAIQHDANHAGAYFLRGLIYTDQGDFAKAKKDLDRAFELNPELEKRLPRDQPNQEESRLHGPSDFVRPRAEVVAGVSRRAAEDE